MIRLTLSALAMFAVSACEIGLPSAIDAVPFEARIAKPAFPDGVYCGLDRKEDGGLVVLSAEEDGDNNCIALKWDSESRLFIISDESGRAPETGQLAFADLGDGLLLMQFDEPSVDGSLEKPWRFTLMAAVAHGEAVGILPLVVNDETIPLAARYPGLVIETYGAPAAKPRSPEDAPEETLPLLPPTRYIASGAPEDIRNFVWDIMQLMFQRASPERQLSPYDDPGLPTLVRDRAGQPDHPPTPAQLSDIMMLHSKLERLAHQ